MTSLALLLTIVLGIALQILIYLGIGFWRHWSDYQDLRARAAQSSLPMTRPEPLPDAPALTPGWSGPRPFRVARKIYEDQAGSICSFYLVPEDGKPLPGYRPGQYLTFDLDVPTAADDTVRIVRCYSLSDAPGGDAYRVSIKRVPAPPGIDVPPGRASNYFHDRVEVGSRLQVRAPAGHFYIERGDAPIVLIAGGIGITPMLSMLNWCLAEQPGREVWLFYGVRHGAERVMKGHLEALAAAHSNFHLLVCLSDPLPEDLATRDTHRGRVDIGLLRMQLPLKPYHFYLCGPTAMMASLVPALEDWGVPEARIHFEAFGPASIKRRSAPGLERPDAATDAGIVVTFSRSAKQLVWQASAGSLLEFAEANGVAVASGCRAGGCGSCQTAITEGEVAYRQAPDYDPEPGSCLLCMCAPKTSLTLEA
jgi:ferredoxin-NADP reductase